MNMDPLAEQYYDLSAYTYVANNPLVFIDPDGQEIIFGFQKDKEGNRIGEQGIKDNINSGLGGGDFAQIDKNGKLSINISDEQRANLTSEQSAFLGVIEEGINATNADGNSVDININVVENDVDIRMGVAESATIDIADINAVEGGEAVTKQSLLGHEIKEQFEMQVGTDGVKVDKYTAHSRAEQVEETITGYARVSTDRSGLKQAIIPSSDKRRLRGRGMRNPYKKALSGNLKIIYNKDTKTKTVIINFKHGNTTGSNEN